MEGHLGQSVGPYLFVWGWIWKSCSRWASLEPFEVCLGLREPSLEPFEFD